MMVLMVGKTRPYRLLMQFAYLRARALRAGLEELSMMVLMVGKTRPYRLLMQLASKTTNPLFSKI